MKEVIVRPDSYTEKMKQLQQTLENMSGELSLIKFETEGKIFSFNDHNVTGTELNKFVDKLQEHLITIRGENKKFLQEIIQAYIWMTSLHKESLEGIKTSVKAAETASQQAKKASQQAGEVSHQAIWASQQAKEASRQALQAQDDVSKTLELLGKSVQHLKEFKERLDHFQHLNDVDEIWSANDQLARSISAVKTELKKTIRDTNKRMERLEFLNGELARCKHLLEVDRLWQNVRDLSEHVAVNKKAMDVRINRVSQAITVLQEFQDRLRDMKHLAEIDKIWADAKKISAHVQDLQAAENDVKNQIADVSARVASDHAALDDRINHARQMIVALQEFQEQLLAMEHLGEIDDIWSEVRGLSADAQNLKTESTVIKKQMEEVSERAAAEDAALDDRINRAGQMIVTLQEFQNRLLAMEHLGDIDEVWSDVRKLSSHTQDLQVKHDEVQGNVADVSLQLKELKERTQAEQQVLTQKNIELRERVQQTEQRIRNAYLLGGGGLGVAVLQLILHFAGVL